MQEGAIYRDGRQLCLVEVVSMRENESQGLPSLVDVLTGADRGPTSGEVLLRGPEVLCAFDRGESVDFVTSGLRHYLTVTGYETDPDSRQHLLRGRWSRRASE